MLKLISLLSLIKWVYDTVMAGYQLYLKSVEKKNKADTSDLESRIENAKTEDDFRDCADKLSKLRREQLSKD